MQVGNHTCQPPVDLLREGLGTVAGTQTGFHVTHPDTAVKSVQSGSHHCGGIALDEHPVPGFAGKYRIQAGEDLGGQPGQSLVVTHEVQVVIRVKVKNFQHLVEHFPVLGCDADARFDPRVCLERADHWSHLHCFRSGTEDRKNAQH